MPLFVKNSSPTHPAAASFLRLIGLLFFTLLLSRSVSAQCTYLTNTDFEVNAQNNGVTIGSQNTMVPPWRTTASDGQIEVWRNTNPAAYSGVQFVELNANVVSTLYQNFTATAGSMFTLGFAHRGRQGTDVMRVSVGTPNPTSATVSSTTLVTVGTYSDDNTAWVYRTVNFTIPSSYTGTTFSIRFESVSSAGGNASIGNFLDAISIADASPTSGRSASYSITCPATTTDLSSYTANNQPANTTQTFHSGTPATDANKLSSTVVPAGTYYSAFYNSVKGCYGATTTITVTQTGAPTAPTVTTTQPSCTLATGTITVTAPTGTSYTYSIDGSTYQSSTSFTGVNPGSYSVTVRNGTSSVCTSSPTTVTINAQPATPAAPTITTSQPNCTTLTGRITVTAPIGTSFTYSIDGASYQSGTSFTGVSPGSYSVTAKSTNGCISNPTGATVIAGGTPAAPTASVTQQPNCTLTTGTIVVSAPTGTGFTYSINGATYQSSTSFTGVSPGSYSVTAKNSAGCVSAPTTVTVTAQPPTPAAPSVSPVQPTCSVTTGTISVTAPTGAGFTYSIDGSTYQSSTSFTGVSPGSYSVTAKNSSGCISAPTVVTINTQPPTPSLTLNSATTCAGQSTTLTVSGCSGGTLLWNTGDNTTSLVVIPVVSTTYTATCTNTSGCTASVSTTVTIRPTPAYTIPPTITPATCTGATANNDAKISLTGLTNTEQANISSGSTYTGPAYGNASGKTVSNGTVSFTGLTNPSSAQYYTVRLYSSGGTCFTDVVFLLRPTTCQCTSCPPVSLKRTQ